MSEWFLVVNDSTDKMINICKFFCMSFVYGSLFIKGFFQNPSFGLSFIPPSASMAKAGNVFG